MTWIITARGTNYPINLGVFTGVMGDVSGDVMEKRSEGYVTNNGVSSVSLSWIGKAGIPSRLTEFLGRRFPSGDCIVGAHLYGDIRFSYFKAKLLGSDIGVLKEISKYLMEDQVFATTFYTTGWWDNFRNVKDVSPRLLASSDGSDYWVYSSGRVSAFYIEVESGRMYRSQYSDIHEIDLTARYHRTYLGDKPTLPRLMRVGLPAWTGGVTSAEMVHACSLLVIGPNQQPIYFDARHRNADWGLHRMRDELGNLMSINGEIPSSAFYNRWPVCFISWPEEVGGGVKVMETRVPRNTPYDLGQVYTAPERGDVWPYFALESYRQSRERAQ